MDIKSIKQIVDLMKRSELTDFEIEEENFKLRICRDNGTLVSNVPHYAPMAPVPQAAPIAPAPAASAAAPAAAEEENVIYVKSPMVGTFYRSPSPESPPFTDIGAALTQDSVVCIIEAMKVMNEIQAEVKGKVLEFLVSDGESVEYGQNLIKLKP